MYVSSHLFYRKKKTDETVHWKCEKYHKNNCRARVSTCGNTITRQSNEYNHAADAAIVEAAKVSEKIREKAKNTNESSHAILPDALGEGSQAAIGKLPSTDCMKRTVRNIRFRMNDGPILSPYRKDINFPEGLTKFSNGEEFLYFGSGNIEERILILKQCNY